MKINKLFFVKDIDGIVTIQNVFRYLPVLIVICGILGFASCSEHGRQQKLVIFSALENDELDDYQKEWRKHHNVKLEITSAATFEIYKKLLELAEKNPEKLPDIIWGIDSACMVNLANKGLLAGITTRKLNQFEKMYYDQRHEPPEWIGQKAFVNAFITNTVLADKLVVKPPVTYDGLLIPALKNRIAIPNPLYSATGLNFIAGVIFLRGEKKGWGYLEKLHKNLRITTVDGSEPVKLAGRGEDGIVVGLSFAYRGFKEKNKGAPLTITFPHEGTAWGIDANAIIRKKKISPVVNTFINWTMSKQMVESYLRRFPETALKNDDEVLENISAYYPKNLDIKLIKDEFNEWKAKNFSRIQQEWKKRFGTNGLKRVPKRRDGR